MNGMRLRPARLPAWSAFQLVSALVLLALACLPAIAQADSSEVQYSNPVPTATGKAPTHHEPVATESGNAGGSPAAPAGGESTSNPSQVGSDKDSSPANGGGAKTAKPKSGTAQGSPGGGSGGEKAAHPQRLNQAGAPSSESGDDSSPLVPILIAIAVLAAISLAAVMFRRRRQTNGSSVSAEAS
jgi:cobalamin biosynthesis Mg chelatase CobN